MIYIDSNGHEFEAIDIIGDGTPYGTEVRDAKDKTILSGITGIHITLSVTTPYLLADLIISQDDTMRHLHAITVVSIKITDENRAKNICPDCSGTGIYCGLTKVSACQCCKGIGIV